MIGKPDIHMMENIRPLTLTVYKNKLKMNKRFKCEIIKLPEEKYRINTSVPWHKYFADRVQKHRRQTQNWETVSVSNFKSSCKAKETIQKETNCTIEKIFVNYPSSNGLRIYKKHKQHKSKRPNKQIKNENIIWIIFSSSVLVGVRI